MFDKRKYIKEYYLKHREKYLKYHRDYYANNKEKARLYTEEHKRTLIVEEDKNII